MAREDWRPQDWREEETRRRQAAAREREDFGQADYSRDYGYDPERRTGYRAQDEPRPPSADDGRADYSSDGRYDPRPGSGYRRDQADDPRGGGEPPAGQPRSWMDRAGEFFAGNNGREARDTPPPRRRGPSDRVLWTVITERLGDERRLDLRDVEVLVEDAEVTLNGTVRHKEDKRRIEDVADIDGVRHVQNNLRLRERAPWMFL